MTDDGMFGCCLIARLTPTRRSPFSPLYIMFTCQKPPEQFSNHLQRRSRLLACYQPPKKSFHYNNRVSPQISNLETHNSQ
ncbi:hypothetical protein Hanom_Chr02g00102031 [Helianthus anomalus]